MSLDTSFIDLYFPLIDSNICQVHTHQASFKIVRNVALEGGSPGLVVMGGDSRSECCGFESQRLKLDGHCSHVFVVNIVMFE